MVLDITGNTYGNLKVIERAPNRGKQTYWLCECQCENKTRLVVRGGDLKNGHTKSCGCLKKISDIANIEKYNLNNGHVLHGQSNSRLYKIWIDMIRRCSNPKCKRYKDYGGKGIKVCAEWENSFESFANWAISNGYSDKLTIDRINNDDGYCPNNCKWSTYQEQNFNKRNTVHVTYQDKIYTLLEIATIFNIPYKNVRDRYYKGWPIDKIISQPIKHR